MTEKWFKSHFSWVIFPLAQPQVARQQKIEPQSPVPKSLHATNELPLLYPLIVSSFLSVSPFLQDHQ